MRYEIAGRMAMKWNKLIFHCGTFLVAFLIISAHRAGSQSTTEAASDTGNETRSGENETLTKNSSSQGRTANESTTERVNSSEEHAANVSISSTQELITSSSFFNNVATSSIVNESEGNVTYNTTGETMLFYESAAVFTTMPSEPAQQKSLAIVPPLATLPAPVIPGFNSSVFLSVIKSNPIIPNSSTGGYFVWEEVEVFMPPDAWPYDEAWTLMNPLRISIVELDITSEVFLAAYRIPGRRFAGKAAYFEPSGIHFLRPVEIRLSFNRNISVPSNMTLATCVYNVTTNTWIQKPSHRNLVDRIDFSLGFIYADTDSFSLYAPLVVPGPVYTLPSINGGILPGQIALAVVLSVFGACMLLFIAFNMHQHSVRAKAEDAARLQADRSLPEGEGATKLGTPPPALAAPTVRAVGVASREVAAAAAPRPEDPTTTYLDGEADGARKSRSSRERAAPPVEDRPPPPPPPPEEIEEAQSALPLGAGPLPHLSPLSTTTDVDTPRVDTQFSHRGPFADYNFEDPAALRPAPPPPHPAPPSPSQVQVDPTTPPDSDEENFELFGAPASSVTAGGPVATTPRSFYEPTSQVA